MISSLFSRERVAFRILLLLAVLTCGVSACRSKVLERPPGYLRIGKLEELLAPETFLPEMRFLVRRDAKGLSAMSTLCTFDLSPLQRKWDHDRFVWVTRYNPSRYSYDGKVIRGPAEADLPYYEVRIEPSVPGGPPDTVYVRVGAKRTPEWRTPLPPNLTSG
jgi:hypothetical protein